MDPTGATASIVVFTVAGEAYALSTLATREVIPWQQPRLLPGTPAFVQGVINLRGEIIPVCDLGWALDLGPAQHGAEACIVIADFEGDSLGLTVDEVRAVLHVEATSVVDAPGVEHAAISGVVRSGSELIVMLDPGALLAGMAGNIRQQVERLRAVAADAATVTDISTQPVSEGKKAA